jgi:DNA/RNA endonuclease G (NUC1)
MDPKKRKKIERRHREWLRDDPLNKRLRAAIEHYRALAAERRQESS